MFRQGNVLGARPYRRRFGVQRSRRDRGFSLRSPDGRPWGVAVHGVLYASAISHAVPAHPGGNCTARDEEPRQPSWYRPRHVHSRTVTAQSPIRIAATPMPVAPSVPPPAAMPTPAASLAHQLDGRDGAEFGWGSLGRGKWSGFY